MMNAFTCVCFLAAVYMTIQQIMRYVEDNDASIVTSKLFNEGPHDKYPTVTFCFTKQPEIIYSEAVHELSISSEDYANILKGVTSTTNNSTNTFEGIVDLDYNMFTRDWRNHISYLEYKTKTSNGTFIYERASNGDQSNNGIELAFYNSYRDPDTVCLSRRSQMNSRVSSFREEDMVVFDLNPFKSNGIKSRGFFSVHIHYPGQLIRSMGKPVHNIPTNTMLRGPESYQFTVTTEISINIGYVSVLKKRSKYQKECNDSLVDDDKEFMLKVINKVGCIPNYWTSLMTKNGSFGACGGSKQLAKVHQLVTNFRSVMSSYEPPCIEMKIPVDVNRHQRSHFPDAEDSLADGWTLTIKMFYITDDFQEIVNVKAFDIETLWSSVGGFIGIFLGYSLLQVPELLNAMWSTSWDGFTLMSWVEYVCAIIMPCLFRKGKFMLLY